MLSRWIFQKRNLYEQQKQQKCRDRSFDQSVEAMKEAGRCLLYCCIFKRLKQNQKKSVEIRCKHAIAYSSSRSLLSRRHWKSLHFILFVYVFEYILTHLKQNKNVEEEEEKEEIMMINDLLSSQVFVYFFLVSRKKEK